MSAQETEEERLPPDVADAVRVIRSGVHGFLAGPLGVEPSGTHEYKVTVEFPAFRGEFRTEPLLTVRDYAIAAVLDDAPLGVIPPGYSELEREALRAITSYQIRASKARTVEELSLRNKQLRKLVGALVLGLLELRRAGAEPVLVAKDVRPWMGIACPYCKAPAGSRCRDKRGDLAIRPHLGRRQAAP